MSIGSRFRPKMLRCLVLFARFGINVKFVEGSDPSKFAQAIDENTKAIYVESIGNPKYNVAPIPELAEVLDQLSFLDCIALIALST